LLMPTCIAPLKTDIIENVREHGEAVTHARYGVLASAGALINTVLPILSGVLVDYYNPPILSLLCTAFITAGYTVRAFGGQHGSFPLLLAGEIIAGMGFVTLTNCKLKLYTFWFRGTRDAGPGMISFILGADLAMDRVYNTIGRQASVLLKNWTGKWYAALWVGAMLCVVSCGVNIVYVLLECALPRAMLLQTGSRIAQEEARHEDGYQDESVLQGFKYHLREIQRSIMGLPAAFWIMTTSQMLQSGVIDAYSYNSSDLIIATRHVSKTVAGYVSGYEHMVPILLTPACGYVFDKFGRRTFWISITATLYIIAFVLLAYTNVNALIPILISSLALSSNELPFSSTIPLMVHKQTSVGTAFGIWTAFYQAGSVIVNVASGALQDRRLAHEGSRERQYTDMFYFLIAVKCFDVVLGFFYHALDKHCFGEVMTLNNQRRIDKESSETHGERNQGLRGPQFGWTMFGISCYVVLIFCAYSMFVFFTVHTSPVIFLSLLQSLVSQHMRTLSGLWYRDRLHGSADTPPNQASSRILLALLLCANTIYCLDNQTTLLYGQYAVPTARDKGGLGGTLNDYLSAVTVFQILGALANLVIGKFSDIFGRGPAFLFVNVCYVLAFALMACARNAHDYFLSMALYALGNSGFTVMTSVLLADLLSARSRAFGIAVFSAPLLALFAVAPKLYAVVLQNSWRWGPGMFAVLIPIATFPIVMQLLGRERAKKSHLRTTTQGLWAKTREFLADVDAAGLSLVCIGLMLTLLPLYQGHWRAMSTWMQLLFGLGVLCIVPLYELHYAPCPILRRQWLHLDVVLSMIITFTKFASFGIGLQFLFSWVPLVLGMDAKQDGFMYFINANMISLTVFGMLAGALAYRYERFKWLLAFGALVRFLGFVFMCVYIHKGTTLGQGLVLQFLQGLGGGIMGVFLQLIPQLTVRREDIAMVSSTTLLVAGVGVGVGVSIYGVLLSLYMPLFLHALVPTLSSSAMEAIVANPGGSLSGDSPYSRSSEMADGIVAAFTAAAWYPVMVGSVLAFVGFVCCLFIGDNKLAANEYKAVQTHDPIETESYEMDQSSL
ncbi:hypothetical protein MVES_000001, partial [Malassezia vespertilionis]